MGADRAGAEMRVRASLPNTRVTDASGSRFELTFLCLLSPDPPPPVDGGGRKWVSNSLRLLLAGQHPDSGSPQSQSSFILRRITTLSNTSLGASHIQPLPVKCVGLGHAPQTSITTVHCVSTPDTHSSLRLQFPPPRMSHLQLFVA